MAKRGVYARKPLKVMAAEQSRVRRLAPEIARILAALGHPEAFVTDESSLWDFLYDRQEDVNTVATALGFKPWQLRLQDLLADIAERMRGVH